MFKAKELTEEQVKQIRESEGGQLKLARQFGISDRRVKLIKEAPSLEEAIKIGKGQKQGEGKIPPTKRGGELGTIEQPGKGTVVFTFGEERVTLTWFHLYDAYQYYRDICRDNGIDEDFSLAIKDCLKYVWEQFNKSRAETQGLEATIEEE